MNDNPCPLTFRHILLRWTVWGLTLTLWTALLVSQQAPHVVAEVVPPDLHFWVAKTAHVTGYMVLSILVGWLPVRMPFRIAWWLFLVCHAGLTEYIQLFVPERHGSWRDVGLDVIGLLLGLVVLRLWRLRLPR